MVESAWRVALVDSGLTPGAVAPVLAARRFLGSDGLVRETEPVPDVSGHGTAIAEVIAASGQKMEWVVAQVLDGRDRTTAATVAAAIHWVLSQGVQLIHLSLGLRAHRNVLADAIGAAVSASVIVVASSPARGEMPYPAAYPKVIRATGDVRCRSGEISALGTRLANYGGCPQHQSSSARLARGASIGAAHVSRFIVQHVPPGLSTDEVHDELQRRAAYRGPERRLFAEYQRV
jgi:subtilisin family serine protease